MPLRAAADIGFAHGRHRDRGLDARIHADLLQRVLHGERVHDGRQHAHIIGGGALESLGGRGDAPENVSAAHDHADFIALRFHIGDLERDAGGDGGVDRMPLAHQHFAGQLQENTFEARASHGVPFGRQGRVS